MENAFIIPVEVCRRVIEQNETKAFYLFQQLKYLFPSGTIENRTEVYKEIAIATSRKDIKYLRRQIQGLLKKGWAAIRGDKKFILLASGSEIATFFDIDTKSKVRIEYSALQNYTDFKSYLAGAYIAHYVTWQQRRKMKCGLVPQKWTNEKFNSFLGAIRPTTSFFAHIGLSNREIAELLGVTKTEAIALKGAAEAARLITVEPVTIPCRITTKQANAVIKKHPSFKRLVVFRDQKVYLQSYDQITSLITFKSKFPERKGKTQVTKCVEKITPTAQTEKIRRLHAIYTSKYIRNDCRHGYLTLEKFTAKYLRNLGQGEKNYPHEMDSLRQNELS